MRKYNTKQRQILIKFFSHHIDEVISTIDIINSLDNKQISESAIYRNLLMLEREGKIHRLSRSGDKKTYYQYHDDEKCIGKIHITCTKCGMTKHLMADTSDKIAKKIKLENGFCIENEETVIYGLCNKCSN